jgi:hypothetical protein
VDVELAVTVGIVYFVGWRVGLSSGRKEMRDVIDAISLELLQLRERLNCKSPT